MYVAQTPKYTSLRDSIASAGRFNMVGQSTPILTLPQISKLADAMDRFAQILFQVGLPREYHRSVYSAIIRADHRSSVPELFKEAILSAYPDYWLDEKLEQHTCPDSGGTTLRERVDNLDAMQLDRIRLAAGILKNELLRDKLTWEWKDAADE